MTTRYYWPYDEVTLDLSGNHEQLIIQAPWLKASLPIAEENRALASDFAKRFGQKTLGQGDLDLIASIFDPLASYPFCYLLPTAKLGEQLDVHHLQDQNLLHLSPEELLKTAGVSASDMASLALGATRPTWEWDSEAAMAFAQTEGGIHPESLLSAIRRFHLLEVMERDEGSEIFQKIESLPPDLYQHIVMMLVRQNHYVTEQCHNSLAPALGLAGQARDHVVDFLSAEKGHDLILASALKSMSEDALSLPVCAATRTLMQLLRYVAGRNLLAFAMVVEMFERSSYEAVDPLASLLARGGFEKAAALVNRHKEINDAGGHENIAASFLEFMAPCSPDYAWEAIRLAELVSSVSSRVTGSVWKLVHDL